MFHFVSFCFVLIYYSHLFSLYPTNAKKVNIGEITIPNIPKYLGVWGYFKKILRFINFGFLENVWHPEEKAQTITLNISEIKLQLFHLLEIKK